MFFGRFYLDREKDIIVDLDLDGGTMTYTLSTPNHSTGNLISNIAKLCGLQLTSRKHGNQVIRGTVPCYINAYNETIYIFRLAGTKVANIYPDGRIEMKASIPAISKTLMSQTKDYNLDIRNTVIKTYIFSDCKFRTDLHTHMNGNLSPDILIALGIYHQIRYPLYYIKKLGLKCTKKQADGLAARRRKTAKLFEDSGLTGKYLDRKIDDNTFINFADLILNNTKNAAYNIPRIRTSLSVLKDGQAVFSNLEKVYLYRYIFTKGTAYGKKIELLHTDRIGDRDIESALEKMIEDHKTEQYGNNTLFQDKLLWIGRSFESQGVRYTEISDTTLVKKDSAAGMLKQVHEVMPHIQAETGVTIRFLAGIRRIPLTIVKDSIAPENYLRENLAVLRSVAPDPYVAGSDILGEEINDIRELAPVIKEIVSIARDNPGFVIRIHAGENDSLRDNVLNSIECVTSCLKKNEKPPVIRVGHGLYTSNLKTPKGRHLLDLITKNKVVLEFQITSNVRLNNLSNIESHPLKQYLKAGVRCVQGTDGCALYGTGSIDEQLSLERLLDLSREDMRKMRRAEDGILRESMSVFSKKKELSEKEIGSSDIGEYYQNRISEMTALTGRMLDHTEKEDAATAFAGMTEEMDPSLLPVIIAGGSFNNRTHRTVMRPEFLRLIDSLLETADPSKVCFVIGHRLTAYEKYLFDRNRGKFRIYAFTPSEVDRNQKLALTGRPLSIRVAIEPSSMGLYKSIAYEIFKRRTSVLLALDGNSGAVNLVQEAKNARCRCDIFVNPHSKMLREKARSLRGYVTMLDSSGSIPDQITEAIR
jgi:adenosine deaminase